MASRGAASARLGLHKIQGELPLAKRDAFGNQLRVSTTVDVVAKRAAPSLILLVHMEVVEVSLTVPEPGGERSIRKSEEIAVVAAKTQAIFLISIRSVFACRKFLGQELLVLRAMWVMTGRADAIVDRTMERRHIFRYDILMAVNTEILSLFQ